MVFSHKRFLALERALHPEAFAIRRSHALSVTSLVKGIVCLPIVLYQFWINRKSRSYFFYDKRIASYCSALEPDLCVLIGSHGERKMAKEFGYSFVWGFPISSSVDLAVWAKNQILFKVLLISCFFIFRRIERIVLFTYTDTQTIGEFFVTLTRLYPSKIELVCIQHGFYVKSSARRILDGEKSKHNFLLDVHQASLFRTKKSRFFDIGLPYRTRCEPTAIGQVVFIGCGHTGLLSNGRDLLPELLGFFKRLDTLIVSNFKLTTVYRPHPSEKKKIYSDSLFTRYFDSVDMTDKVGLLSGNRKIFIGSFSTLLYEAAVAGHVVIYVDPEYNDMKVLFRSHFSSTYFGVLPVIQFIENVVRNHVGFHSLYPELEGQADPALLFKQALECVEGRLTCPDIFGPS